MKKTITIVVRKFSFGLEITYAEFDNNILINCFLWSGWHNWEIPHSSALGPYFKKLKLNKSFKSLRSQCYQHLYHGYCHHHYHIHQAFTCAKLTMETLKQGVNLIKVNSNDTRATSLRMGKCPVRLKPFQRLFSLLYPSFSWKRFFFIKILRKREKEKVLGK